MVPVPRANTAGCPCRSRTSTPFARTSRYVRLRSNLQAASRVTERRRHGATRKYFSDFLGKVVDHGATGPDLSPAPSPVTRRCAGSCATDRDPHAVTHDGTERHQDVPDDHRPGSLVPVHIYGSEPGHRARRDQPERDGNGAGPGRQARPGRLQLQGRSGHDSRAERVPDGSVCRRPAGDRARLRSDGHLPGGRGERGCAGCG